MIGNAAWSIFLFSLCTMALCLSGCATSHASKENREAPPITLKPVTFTELTPPARLGFSISVPWMDGDLIMRMPETVNSFGRLHFIDHFRPDLPANDEMVGPPVWRTTNKNQGLAYTVNLKSGLVFGGEVWVDDETIELVFTATNTSDQEIQNVCSQQCLVMTDTAQFGDRNTLAPMHAWFNGEYTSLAKTTPTPAEMGRKVWILMPTHDQEKDPLIKEDSPNDWFIVKEYADEYIIACESKDKEHLVAITWDEDPSYYLMTNAMIPCLHAGPQSTLNIKPGETVEWRGRIFLMDNDPERLLKLYKAKR